MKHQIRLKFDREEETLSLKGCPCTYYLLKEEVLYD